jgi:type VI protein secretion system component Hcp
MPSYMKPDGIAGYDRTKVNGPNKPDPGWCPLTNCHYGVHNTSQNASKEIAGEIVANAITVQMLTDATVIALLMRCTSGELISTVVLEDCNADAGMTVQGRLTLTDVRVQDVKTEIDAGTRKSTIVLLYRMAKWEIRTPDGAYQEFEYQNRAA